MTYYTAELDGITILDPENDITLGSPELELADNSAGSFSFDVYRDNPIYESIAGRNQHVITVKRDEEVLWKGRVLRVDPAFDGTKSVYAEGELGFLDDSIQRPGEYHNISVRGFLQKLLERHNATAGSDKQISVGTVTVTDSNDSLYRYTNWESTLKAIQEKLVDRLVGHLRLRYEGSTRYLDYLAESPKTASQTIDFGQNLLDYVETRDGTDIATVCIPLGARLEEKSAGYPEALEERLTISSVNSGSDEISIGDAVAKYGRVTKTVTFDDVHTPQILMDKGQEWLTNAQYETVQLKVTALDLARFGLADEPFDMLDRIRCHSDLHGLDRTFPLLEMTIHPLEPESDTFSLGSADKTFTSTVSAAQQAISDAIKTVDTSSILSQALQNAQELINSQGKGGHVVLRSSEILIMDTDDIETAQNVWRWNQAGFAHSISGYQGPYTLAITMDGHIAGQVISAGTIEADKLSVSARAELEQYTDDALGGYWTAVETEAKISAAVDGISLEVSDRLKVNENLLINSRNPQDFAGLVKDCGSQPIYSPYFRENCFRAEQTGSVSTIVYTSRFRVSGGDKLTVSGDYRSFCAGGNLYIVLCMSKSVNPAGDAYDDMASTSKAIVTGENQRFEHTFTVPTGMVSAYVRLYTTLPTGSWNSQATYFTCLKVERGSVATAWDLNRSEVVNSASIKILSDSITSKVTAGEVESIIEQKASSIRLQATTITWTASKSKMLSDGTIRSGPDNGYWIQLASGELTGGYSGSQYAKIDASAESTDLRYNVKRKGIQMTGECVRITTRCLSTLDSTSESTTHLIGHTGDVPVITEIQDNGDGTVSWTTTTLHFENGLMVSDY